jgi:DNA invertase Pin-like site-specific DNA recombinase
MDSAVKVSAYIRSEGERGEIATWLESRGMNPYRVEWFNDKNGETTADRPGFDSLQRAISDGKVTCVILWKVDRLSLRLLDGVKILADWAARGLKLVVVSQQIEIDGPECRKFATLLQELAEIEQEFRKERQQAGIAVARKNGTYKGRKKGTTKASLERARELKESGLSLDVIADTLGISKRTAFRYLLRSRSVAGH